MIDVVAYLDWLTEQEQAMKFNVYYHCNKDGGTSIIPHLDNPAEYVDIFALSKDLVCWKHFVPKEYHLHVLEGVWIELAEKPVPERPTP